MTSSLPLCACGSQRLRRDCCGPLLDGLQQAETAEQLMRSRYVAYVERNHAYLLRTWYRTGRPADLDLETPPQPDWLALTVRATTNGGSTDSKGTVSFTADYSLDGQRHTLSETSRFLRDAGYWYYLDGDIGESGREHSDKHGRNTPCPCGSGKKYKRCCGK